MKVDNNGGIAYHVIRLREDLTGSDVIQFDFDGSIESVKPFREYAVAEDLSSSTP